MKKHSNTESDNYGMDVVERDDDYPPPLSKNRTIQAQALERAEILLPKEAGKPDKSVAEGLCIDVSTVRLCVKKYLEGGTELALYDRQRKGRPAEISTEAVAWVINLTCQRPADLGYSQKYGRWRSAISIYRFMPPKRGLRVLQQFQRHGFNRFLRNRKSSRSKLILLRIAYPGF